MRITQTLLTEYVETESQLKALETRKAAIREAILSDGRQAFELGEFAVSVVDSERTIPLPLASIREIIGIETTAKILQTVRSKRVSVKKAVH